ncbi:hypothetical protein [Streptomyces iranensis]|uniref:hypothetical protein n=1 Tax=Streptomyces iranensis TaxID=576784 RepID=UPI0039B7261E
MELIDSPRSALDTGLCHTLHQPALEEQTRPSGRGPYGRPLPKKQVKPDKKLNGK